MANEIKNKWIGSNEVDGRVILLENAQFVRAKKADDSIVNLFQLAADNRLIYEQCPILSDASVQSDDSLALQTKQQVEALVQVETDAREAADDAVIARVDSAEAAAALEAARLTQEISDRVTADNTQSTNLSSEVSRATAREDELEGLISAEEARALAAEGVLDTRITDELSDIQTSISDETAARISGDNALGGRIDQEILDRQNADDAEASARQSADNNLDTRINDVETSVSDEEARALAAEALLIPLSQKGVADGVATLDGSGKVPSAQLPSYVDDVLEVADFASLPASGEPNKLYVTIDDHKVYRWSGTVYSEVSPSEVKSVNGKVGLVTLNSDEIPEGTSNLYYTDARVNDVVDSRFTTIETSVSDHESRITTLEQVQSPAWAPEFKALVDATIIGQGYVDLPHEVVPNGIASMSVDRVVIHEEEVSISLSGGVTRITFGSGLMSKFSINPPTDNFYCKYQYVPVV